jgi:hypothetical protein
MHACRVCYSSFYKHCPTLLGGSDRVPVASSLLSITLLLSVFSILAFLVSLCVLHLLLPDDQWS